MKRYRKALLGVSAPSGKPIIVHITDGHCAFDDRIFYKELRSLSKRHRCYELVATKDGVTLSTMGGERREQGEYDGIRCLAFKGESRSLIIRGIRHFFTSVYNELQAGLFCKRIRSIFAKERIHPEIIHFHDLTFAPVAIMLKKELGCKLIFDSHEFFFSYPFNKGIDRKTCHMAEKALLQWKKAIIESDFAIACTATMDNLISMIRQDDNHDIVYNSSFFTPQTRRRSLDKNRKIVLLHEGSMPFNRGLQLMLEIFRDEYIRNNFQLRIVGTVKGEEKRYFENKCCEYNLTEENVYFTGWVDYPELPNVLRGDIGIIFFEKTFNAFYSMPNKLYTYHVAGIPVIATHCADLSDMIKSMGTGVVVERTVSAVKEGLREIAEHYEKYQEQVLLHQGMFHWSTDEKRLLNIYERVLDN